MTTLQEVRARFARDQGLPFADSLSELSILDALNEHGVKYRDRLFGPVTTPSGASSARSSARTTAAATPWLGSSPTARRPAWRCARPTRPATATPAPAC